MTTFAAFDRDLRLATADLEPAAINAELAKFARVELAKVIAAGAGPQYEKAVNGRPGAPEESVKAPGPIVYSFSNWPVYIEGALAELRKRAPRKSGRYAASFIVIVGGKIVTDYKKIPAGSEVVIFNARPQTRRIEAGANKSTGKRHFELAAQALNRRFSGSFVTNHYFLNVREGVHPLVPYRLKSSLGRRKGRQKGDVLTYPALVANSF